MLKLTKKISFVLVLFLCVLFVGCEDSLRVRCAAISEVTSAGSSDYAVTVTTWEDERVENYSIDVFVKASEACEIKFWQEGQDKVSLTFSQPDYWESLSALRAEASGEQSSYELFSDFGSATYLFNGDGVTLTFRVMIGETVTTDSGEVFVSSEPVSEELSITLKAQ